jgi:hypothetical protein
MSSRIPVGKKTSGQGVRGKKKNEQERRVSTLKHMNKTGVPSED